MSDQEEKAAPTLAEKLQAATKPLTATEHAAAQRADYKRALEEERAGYEKFGKDDRVKGVDAELKRLAEEAKPARQSTRAAG